MLFLFFFLPWAVRLCIRIATRFLCFGWDYKNPHPSSSATGGQRPLPAASASLTLMLMYSPFCSSKCSNCITSPNPLSAVDLSHNSWVAIFSLWLFICYQFCAWLSLQVDIVLLVVMKISLPFSVDVLVFSRHFFFFRCIVFNAYVATGTICWLCMLLFREEGVLLFMTLLCSPKGPSLHSHSF